MYCLSILIENIKHLFIKLLLDSAVLGSLREVSFVRKNVVNSICPIFSSDQELKKC